MKQEPMVGQSPKHSFYESLINVIIGYFVAIGSQMIILPLYGIHIPIEQNLTMGLLFTVISFVRSYIIRRWFNNITNLSR
jgi:uncharacterized protein YqgC (DUF456 family)